MVVIHAPAAPTNTGKSIVISTEEQRIYAYENGQLEWSGVPEKDDRLPQRGRLPHPEAAYSKAYLVMVNEKFDYKTDLYAYLCDHPALVWVAGFRLVAETTSVYGFDVAGSVPGARHLRRKLGALEQGVPTALLAQTVQQAVAVMPGLGETVSVDVKHIHALWGSKNQSMAEMR